MVVAGIGIASVEADAEIFVFRTVRSSNGHFSMRPVIVTTVRRLGQEWLVELTLAAFGDMGFRMLPGHEAVRGRFVVDAGQSWYVRKPGRSIRKPRSTPAPKSLQF